MIPVISICIPTLNRAAYLRECLNSISLISEPISTVIEIIVSNNFSDDSTRRVLESYATLAEKFAGYTVINHEERLPAYKNWLSCVHVAKAEHIWLISDDDLVNADGITSLICSNTLEDFSLVICDSVIINKDGRAIGSSRNRKRLEIGSSQLALFLALKYLRYKFTSVIWRKSLAMKERVFEYAFPSSGICLDGAIMAATSERALIENIAISSYRVHQLNDCRSGTLDKFLIGRNIFNTFILRSEIPVIAKVLFLFWNITGVIVQSISPSSGLSFYQRLRISGHIPIIIANILYELSK